MKRYPLLFRIPGSLFNRAVRYLNRYVLHPIDCWITARSDKKLKYPPIFIIGAPRSGSTLLVQVLTDAFDLGYICNSHCRLFGSLSLANKFKGKGQRNGEYQSHHGVTNGGSSPSECGNYWYRFFRKKPTYVTIKDVDEKKMRCFRGSITSFSNSIGKSILFKNLYTSLRLQPLIRTFPEALFIVIRRDELDNGCSLLEGRMKVFGSYEKWWSVEPDNIERLLPLPAHEQVIEQVRSIYRIIDKDIVASKINSSKVMYVNYEDFCQNVQKTLDMVDDFFQLHAINALVKNSVPASFKIRKNMGIEINLYSDLKKYVRATSEAG